MSHETPTWQRVAQGRAEECSRAGVRRCESLGPSWPLKVQRLWEASRGAFRACAARLDPCNSDSFQFAVASEAALKGVLRFAVVLVTGMRVCVFLRCPRDNTRNPLREACVQGDLPLFRAPEGEPCFNCVLLGRDAGSSKFLSNCKERAAASSSFISMM